VNSGGGLPPPIPYAPSYIKGVINLPGSVLAIIGLAARLGLWSAEINTTSVIVVIEAGDRVIGLLVDAVSDIITVTDEMRQVTATNGGILYTAIMVVRYAPICPFNLANAFADVATAQG